MSLYAKIREAITTFVPDNYRPNPAYTFGPWHVLHRVNVVCMDCKVRRATINSPGEPDTWFSTAARVKVNGKTVSGWITPDDNYGDANVVTVYRFYAWDSGKNGHLLPANVF